MAYVKHDSFSQYLIEILCSVKCHFKVVNWIIDKLKITNLIYLIPFLEIIIWIICTVEK